MNYGNIDASSVLVDGSPISGGSSKLSFDAQDPNSYNETYWSENTRAGTSYSDTAFSPSIDFDYNTGEWYGAFNCGIATTTSLQVKLVVIPSNASATGDNCQFQFKHANQANTISTATGTLTALSAVTTITETITVTSGDLVQLLIGNLTTVTSPKQCDWQILAIEVSYV